MDTKFRAGLPGHVDVDPRAGSRSPERAKGAGRLVTRRPRGGDEVSGFEPHHVEALQKHLARELDTDPAATPSTQATRLVGYNNHKYKAAHLVTIDYSRTDRLYTPTEFPPVQVAPGDRTCDGTRSLPPTQASAGSYEGRRRLDLVERARRCLARVPPAIAGEHGDVHTFRVCCRLARGFALEDDLALAGVDGVELPMSAAMEGAGAPSKIAAGQAIWPRAICRIAIRGKVVMEKEKSRAKRLQPRRSRQVRGKANSVSTSH